MTREFSSPTNVWSRHSIIWLIFYKKYEGILYFLYGGVTGHLPHLSVTSKLHSFVLQGSTLSLRLLLLLLLLPLLLSLFLFLILLCHSLYFSFTPIRLSPSDLPRWTDPRSTLWLLLQIRTSCSCLVKGKTISPCHHPFLSFVHRFLALATIMAAHEPRSSR